MATYAKRDVSKLLLNFIFIHGFVFAVARDLNYDNNNEGARLLRDRELRHQYMRCTRRFTPGACATPVRPVWTFAFSVQNCTERLGCPRDPRSNRFRSHSRCMRHCQGLIDLYTHILASGNNNETEIRSLPQNNTSRREGDETILELHYEDNKENYENDTYDESTIEDIVDMEDTISDIACNDKEYHVEFAFLEDMDDSNI